MRNNNLDLLRFLFAFIVIIGHLIVISQVEAFQQYSPYISTRISVTGFFVISGFLITKSYIKTDSLKNYFLKRIARLYPAYILVLILSSIFLSIISTFSIKDYFFNIQLYKYLISNLTFLNFINPTLPGVFLIDGIESPVNGALWTLKIEVGFYLLIPFLIYFIQKFKRKYIPLIGIFVFSIAYQFLCDRTFSITGNNLFILLSRQLPGYLTYFVCGIALYYYFDLLINNKLILFIVGILILFIVRTFDFDFLFPIALALIVFVFAYRMNKLNNFAKYGDMSYGIYIYHCPIINLAVYMGLFKKYNPYLVALFVIIIVLILSFISWHLLEKKILKKVHRIINSIS